ncbi:MAG TPA: type II toxin-antitoxin system VapC family toxin [archaeon]|nr:type II toxin-antitoxin system VapC family toxin [archaeon]
MNYYIDTCIWLNLFNIDEAKTKQSKCSKELIEKILFSKKHKIFYSGFVLRELEFKLKESYEKKRKWFKSEPNLIFIKATKETYNYARKLEKENNYKISFFDYIHLTLTKETNSILITRDKELLNTSKDLIIAQTPENALKRINFS